MASSVYFHIPKPTETKTVREEIVAGDVSTLPSELQYVCAYKIGPVYYGPSLVNKTKTEIEKMREDVEKIYKLNNIQQDGKKVVYNISMDWMNELYKN